MERLTYWNEEYGCWSYHGPSGEAAKRLAAYEDTGLTPGEVHSMSGEWRTMMSVLNSIGGGYGRLRELAEADKDGRLVVLQARQWRKR